MKQHIEKLLLEALTKLYPTLDEIRKLPIQVTPSRNPAHGDFASNIALVVGKHVSINPKILAEKIIAALPASSSIRHVEIAGPGFINFFLAEDSLYPIISKILKAGKQFGETNIGKNKRVHIEYVSANPTGPLHVGHGRGAAYGACVANLLKAVGFDVHREYYVNDAGRQMGILAISVWIRYLQIYHEPIDLPKNAYQGQYIMEIAQQLVQQYEKRFYRTYASIETEMPNNISADTDPEIYLDAYIQAAKQILQNDYQIIFKAALDNILADIQNDLEEFGVVYDEWFYETRLMDEGLIAAGVDLLKKHGYVYEKEGAQWFRATDLGDEKDRVLIRKNGQSTYFASDVAYHLYKYQQGYDLMIDVFGADHHGFIARINAFLTALGKDAKKLRILLVQFAILYRGKEKISMSTRGGTFVTLRELRKEVGNDAARFFYIMRKPEQHLDFDLELAKSKSSENPVYYIQYAHARICSIWRQLQHNQINFNPPTGLAHLSTLTTTYEKDLLQALAQYPDLITHAALHYEPHLIAHYLQTLAHYFHTYYNAERFLVEKMELRNARLTLIAAVQQVIANGLNLLGVSAPEEM